MNEQDVRYVGTSFSPGAAAAQLAAILLTELLLEGLGRMTGCSSK
jgi:hypothetical protein